MGITLILPVKGIELQSDKDLLKEVVRSINEQTNSDFELLIAANNTEKDVVMEICADLKCTPLKYFYDGEVKYQNLMTTLVENINNPFFAVVEQDDFLMPTFVQRFYDCDHLTQSKAVIMTLPLEINNNGGVMGVRNESFWAVNANDKIGELSYGVAKKNIQNISLDGAYISVAKFKEYGGFKDKIEIFFPQELVLRMLHKGEEMSVVPKILLKHRVNRVGSYFDVCSKTMDEEQRRIYYDKMFKEHLTNKNL